MTSYVIIDIDHTLADAAWRDHLIGGDWDVYHEQAHKDEPFEHMKKVVEALNKSLYVIALTARPKKWRTVTLRWLAEHGFAIDELVMRDDDDFRPAHELKLDLVRKRIPNLDAIVCVIDDRQDVLDAFLAAGVPGLLVRNK